MRIASFLLTALLLLGPAQAWNEQGHRTVAQVADSQLSPAARRYVTTILEHHPFPEIRDLAAASVWPDQVRSDPAYHHGNWHYSNLPLFLDLEEEPKVDGGRALSALNSCTAVLKDPRSSAQDKAIALAWVAHLLGDMHQPLHAVNGYSKRFPDGDRGGNDVEVLLGTTPLNLHAFWDSAGGLFWQDANAQRIEVIARGLESSFPREASAEERSPLAWQAEGFELAREVVYPGAIFGEALSEAYVARAQQVCEQRMALGGYRLAGYLERLAAASPVQR